jgi:hypothetical protein
VCLDSCLNYLCSSIEFIHLLIDNARVRISCNEMASPPFPAREEEVAGGPRSAPLVSIMFSAAVQRGKSCTLQEMMNALLRDEPDALIDDPKQP